MKSFRSVSPSQMRWALPATYIRTIFWPCRPPLTNPQISRLQCSSCLRHCSTFTSVVHGGNKFASAIVSSQLLYHTSILDPVPCSGSTFLARATAVFSTCHCPRRASSFDTTPASRSIVPPTTLPPTRDPSCRDQACPSAETQCSRKSALLVVRRPRATEHEKAQRADANTCRVQMRSW